MDARTRPRIGLIALLALLAGSGPLCAQTAWYEGFEAPQPTWREAGANVRYRVEAHQRVQGEAHTGRGSEYWKIAGVGAGYVYVIHDVGHPRVIDELLPTVWVKGDRPGIQLLARVVLPRASDPQSGRPLTTTVGGSGYTRVGAWQQLRIDNLPELLSRQSRVLQSQARSPLDVREAYLDGIVLNLYGGQGTTNVWIDDLDLAGFVEASGAGGPAAGRAFQAAPTHPPLATGRPTGPSADAPSAAAAPPGGQVKFEQSILSIDGRATFPRALRHQGEPLALVKQLGFNAVWLSRQPALEMLEEAGRLGLWVICPPPFGPGAAAEGEATSLVIGPGFDRVLVWDLGSRLTGAELDSVRQWAEQVGAADRRAARPLICRPESDLWAYSHFAHLLLVGRSPLGTSLEMADYGTWVRERPRLARPGTAIWTTVQTQPARSLTEQWTALARGEPVPTSAASEQIRLLAYTAITAGSRGLLFESDSPLSAQDPDTRARAMTLELLNLELDLVEPWAAAGQPAATVGGSEPEVTAVMLRTEHARLLVPIWSAAGAQCVSGQAAAHGVSFVVPGVPESNKAYELTPGGLKSLQHNRKRVTGGVRVTLDEFGLTSLVLFTEDPLVVGSLTRLAQLVGPRAARLQRDLAADKLRLVEQIHARLKARTPVPQAAEWIASAKRSLQTCDGLLAAKDYPGAYLNAHRAMRPLRLLERAHWQAAVAGLRSAVAGPAAVSFRTLPWHQAMMEFVAAAQPGANQLPGGDFEDLGAMLQAGWQHFPRSVAGVHGEANLATAAAHSGRLGLRLAAQAAERQNTSPLVETPPVWMASPEVPVNPGSLVRIQGWAQVRGPITGSVDGLMIVDSIGGEPLADRIDATDGWKQFTLYRVAPQSGRVSVTFALTGLGEAWLDDVSIQVLDPGRGSGGTP